MRDTTADADALGPIGYVRSPSSATDTGPKVKNSFPAFRNGPVTKRLVSPLGLPSLLWYGQ